MNSSETIFLKSLKFDNKKLTEKSNKQIEIELKKNKFKGYFKWQNWRVGEIVSLFSQNENIYLLSYILKNYLDQLSEQTQLDLYQLLLAFKMENNECQSGLELISLLDEKFAKDLFILNVKGNFYRILGWHKEALETFNYILDILKIQENNNENAGWESRTKYNIAIIYANKKEYKKAIVLFEEHLISQKKKGHKMGISMCYMNLAHVYNLKKDFKKAIEYNYLAQKIKQEIGDKLGSEMLNINAAEMHVDAEDVLMAEKHLEICKDSENNYVIEKRIQLELRVNLQKLRTVENITELEKNKLYILAQKSLESIEKSEVDEEKKVNYLFIADALELSGHQSEAIKILKKRYDVFNNEVERNQIKLDKQIRATYEFQIQQKEIEKKKKLLKQKGEMNVKLKLLNDELEQFTYMASHDLKSPLRTILSICTLIKDESLSTEELQSYLGLIKNDALKINELVSALLVYYKIGYTNVEIKNIKLNILVKRVLANLSNDIKAKNAKIELADLPNIMGNESLLETLFQNILSNALIYNDNENIEIVVRTALNGESIEIEDNGIGIPENKIKEIFKAFTRAHSATKNDGSGVGLATCKKIMNIHSGNISVHSKVGKGSCFTLNFNKQHKIKILKENVSLTKSVV